jgi:flagellar hook-associated protein 1 FlgK
LSFSTANDYQLLDANGQALNPPITGTIGAFPATITTPEGFEIRVPAGVAAGDNFRIQPTRSAARDIGVALTKPRELALGFPISTGTSLQNTGTGQISAGKMINSLTGAGALQSTFSTPNTLTPPLLVRFTSATTYEILDNTDPNAPVAMVPPQTGTIVPGQNNTVTVNDPVSGDPVYSFDVSGYPANGDEFTISYNNNGSSDNRNAVAMGDLRLTDLVGGNMTAEEAYGALISIVGSNTAELLINREATNSLLSQAQANRDAVSSVNLDEEAANLIRFEQAYNASAQVINIARSLFDSLLAAVR